MARKVTRFTVEDGNRDRGRVYELTEMAAGPAEAWAIRTLMAIAKSGVDLPDDWEEMSLPMIASLTLQALTGVRWEEAEPLLDDLMSCVKIVASENVIRPLMETDIEEVLTRLRLRRAVFELHFDFFDFASRSISTSTTSKAGASSDIPTSRPPAAP